MEFALKFPWYEYVIYIAPTVIGLAGGWLIMRCNWQRYGLLFALSALTGSALCAFFVICGFYKFPNNPLHDHLTIPVSPMVTFVPLTVCIGVRYSPRSWPWKIPFYWVLVHLAILAEVLLLEYTKIFRYSFGWDLWSSYTWWWMFYLFFEWVGGRIVPEADKRPLQHELFRYGNWGWIVFHLTVISTIFIFGMYTGKLIWDR